jgi:hypothetical protein
MGYAHLIFKSGETVKLTHSAKVPSAWKPGFPVRPREKVFHLRTEDEVLTSV